MIVCSLYFAFFFCCCLTCHFYKPIKRCLCLSHQSTYFLKCLCLNCRINTCCLHSINCICQCLCILDKCRQELFACHIDHSTSFNIDCLSICLILNLCTRLKLCFCEYIKSLKQFYSLVCCDCRNCFNHRLNVRKSSSLSLCNPRVRVSVSVEDDSLVLCQVFFDQIMYCKIKVICFLKNITCICKCFRNDCVQYDIRVCDRIS